MFLFIVKRGGVRDKYSFMLRLILLVLVTLTFFGFVNTINITMVSGRNQKVNSYQKFSDLIRNFLIPSIP